MLSTSKRNSTTAKQLPTFISELIKYQQWLAMKNGVQLTSWQALGAGIASTTKAMLKWLVTTPAGWCMIAATAIFSLKGIIDAVTISTEEYRERLDEVKSEASEITTELNSLNSELETTNKRIKELESKGKLSFSEQEEYENLVKENAERQRKIDLLNLEAQKKSKETNKAFVDTMKSDIRSNSEYSHQETRTVTQYNRTGNPIETEMIYTIYDTEEEHIKREFDRRANLKNQLKTVSSKEQRTNIENQIKDIDDYFLEKSKQWTKDSNDIQYIPNPTTEDEKAVNEYLDFINDFQDRMAIAMDGDNAKTNAFNRIVDNVQFDETVQELQTLGKEGKVTAEMLKDDKYSDFIQKLVSLRVIDSAENLDDIALAFNNISTSTQTASDSVGDSRTKMISSINSMSDGFETLNKISSSMKDNEPFDFALLDDDKFKKTFSGLGDVYTDFIKTITDNSDDFDACQNAFNNLATEWINSTGILDNVTEENEKLTASMLKQMGVANADELAHYGLEKAKAKEYIQTKENNGVKESETKVTHDNINELIQNANAAGIATNAYIELKAKEILFGNNSFSTQNKCAQLLELAKSAGIATIEMSNLESELNAAYNRKNGMTRKEYAESKGIKVLTEEERIKNGEKNAKGKGNLYIVGNQTFEGLKKAVYQKESNDTIDRISSTFANVNIGDYSGNTDSASDPVKETKETFNWIETALSRIQRKITNFGKTVSATWKSWTDRNNALKDQISSVNKELDLQYQARARYEQQANSVALDENTKRLVREGAIDITTVDSNTADLIKEYQEWHEKILECDDAIIDLQDELANLAQTKFDNLSKQFEDQTAFVDHEIAMLESTADLLETRGYIASKSVYTSLIQNSQSKKEILQSQRNTLMDTLNNSGIEKGTEAWNKMYLEILNLDEEILKLDNDTAGYQNSLRELDWEVFDIIQKKISGVTDEAEFLIDLMSNDKMFNEDGSATEQGQATLGLHAMNYEVYMRQADDYTKALYLILKSKTIM